MSLRETPPPGLRAALRDASWYRCPQTFGPVKYHVVVEDAGIGGCAVWTIPYNTGERGLPAENTPLHMRCMRPGCRSRWPAYVDPKKG